MSHLHFRRGRLVVRAVAGVILAFPLAGAECADLTTPGGASSAGASYDGAYVVVEFDGKSGSGGTIIDAGGGNRLVLEKGVWTVSNGGKRLDTQMYTYQVLNGVRQPNDPRFYPEKHFCDVTISNGTASCTLDSGTSISATIGGGLIVTSYGGTHTLKFQKQ